MRAVESREWRAESLDKRRQQDRKQAQKNKRERR